MIKKCCLCNNKFEVISTKNARQTYCFNCTHKPCKFCGKIFHFYPRPNSKRKQNIYCSKSCKAKDAIEKKGNNWKGDNVGYFGLHKWVREKLGSPKKCEHCGTKKRRIVWANKSREYKRELADWIALCEPCHKIYDRTTKKRKSGKIF